MTTNDSRTFTVENNIYKGEITTSNCKSIGDMMWNKIKSHGDKTVHLDAVTEQVVTYAEFQDKIIKCALWLQEQGIKPTDVVTVCSNNHFNTFVPCLAAIYVNAIFNPWNENMDLRNTLHVMQLITPKIIFCSEKSVSVILSAIKETNCNPTIVIFDDLNGISFSDILSDFNGILFSDILSMYSDDKVATFQYVECNDIKKTMCIMHSSGTTGMPKGVELSNYCLLRISEDKNIDLIDAVAIWFSSLYWITGVMMNLMVIAQGAKIILYPEFDEEMICPLIEKHKITMALLSANMINRFLRVDHIKKFSLPTLKVIIFSGAVVKPKIHEEIRCILSHVQILQVYGMTEFGFCAMQCSNHKNGSCGTVIQNVEIKVMDVENVKALGPNNLGELWIKMPTLMNGYYRNPEATKNTIDKEGWLHSGDIGYFDKDGELFVIDRIKDLIKYRGHQISPGEIEGVLMSHPAVLEAAVIGIPHAIDNEHPLAYVTKMPGVEVTEQELIDLVAKNMMDQYKLRAGVIFLNALPRTYSGKIAKKELKAMAKKLILE